MWEMQAIYHRFGGLIAWKRCWSIAYLPGNEAAKTIDYRSTSFPGAAALLFIHEWSKFLNCMSRLPEKKKRSIR